MLHFEGYGIKNNTQKSRDDIIKSGWKHNADVIKVNDVLASFNAQPLTIQETLEYLIKDSIDKMTINTPAPEISDFGITPADIKKISTNKNIFYFNIITVLIISGIFSSITRNEGIVFITLIAYLLFGFFYFNFNKNHKKCIDALNLYNEVMKLYSVKHKELEDVMQRIIEEEKERQRRIEEEERKKQELFERQQLDYWESIINNQRMSTSERGQIFEREMTKLFKQLGWDVRQTQASKDGGVDIIIDIDNERCLVQCKFYKGKVGVEPVRALWGIKDSYNADRVMMLAYSGVTQGGEDFAAEKNRGRSKGDWLYKICDKHDVIRWYGMAGKR